MSKANTTEQDMLELIFHGTDPSWRTGGNLYAALFTSDPTEAGSTANEATYTGYARIAVSKDVAGFTRSSSTVTNAADIDFGACSGGTETITHFAWMTASSGGQMIASGSVNPNIPVATPVQPRFLAGQVSYTED